MPNASLRTVVDALRSTTTSAWKLRRPSLKSCHDTSPAPPTHCRTAWTTIGDVAATEKRCGRGAKPTAPARSCTVTSAPPGRSLTAGNGPQPGAVGTAANVVAVMISRGSTSAVSVRGASTQPAGRLTASPYRGTLVVVQRTAGRSSSGAGGRATSSATPATAATITAPAARGRQRRHP